MLPALALQASRGGSLAWIRGAPQYTSAQRNVHNMKHPRQAPGVLHIVDVPLSTTAR
jgi:hypothetical protein